MQEAQLLASAAFRALAERENLEFRDVRIDTVSVGRATYVTAVAEIEGELTVRVHELREMPGIHKGTSVTATVAGSGRVTRANVAVPAALTSTAEPLAVAIADACASVYVWLEAHVMAKLDALRNAAADELYLRLRKGLPPNVVEHVWLYVIADGSGIYVPDYQGRRTALAHATSRHLNPSLSPLELITDLFTQTLAADSTHSAEAIASGSIIQQEFARAKYASTGLQVAEEAVYDCRDYLIHPLVREGSTLLTAGYPRNQESVLHEPLQALRADFKDVIGRSSSRLRRVVRSIAEQGSLPSWTDQAARGLGILIKTIGDPRT